MTRTVLCLLFAAASVSALDNGLALTPPRGWRSWNAFDCTSPDRIITDTHMVSQMLAVLDKSRLVDGKPTSLAELGFDWISMDDGWQQCNCSTRQDEDPDLPKCPNLCFDGFCTWHDKNGVPLVRESRFPDMKSLVDYGHSLGLKVGTYLNNCICMERNGSPTHYTQDVQWMMDMGFDEVKIDNCGTSGNVSHFAELFNATGKPIRVENCHNSWPDFKTGFCPMNFFRTGGDISPDIGDILGQAYATVEAADLPVPKSRPGCWGYPDMSEIGNFGEGPSREAQEQTHWGLWCIISSPLILGLDLNDTARVDRIWNTVTNTDALSVSEAWAGHPGTLMKAYLASGQGFHVVQSSCDGSQATRGWRFYAGGALVAPQLDSMVFPQCLAEPAASACPPPTSRFKDVKCGLLLSNCTPAEKSWRWELEGNRVQWTDGANKPQCVGAFPGVFEDVPSAYFTRRASTVRMGDCTQLTLMCQNSSCGQTRSGVDVDGAQVITPKNTSTVCNVDLHGCCSACDKTNTCKGYVWKQNEPYGINCTSGSSYCWLLSDFSGLHAAQEGTFGSKAPLPPPPPSPSPSPPAPPSSPEAFELTIEGELRSLSGDRKCLAVAPLNGIELWAKPLGGNRIAILLVNPLGQPQELAWPLADLPRFAGVDLTCTPGKCNARNVWAHHEGVLVNDHIEVSLSPFASDFYIISLVGGEPSFF